MQIKTTMRYCTPIRIAKIKNDNTKCWQGCGETGLFIDYWWECKMVQPLCKTAL